VDKKGFFRERSERTLQKRGRGRPSQIPMNDLEKQTLEKLKTKSYALVAQEEKVEVGAIYKRMQRLLDRVDEAQKLVNQRNAWGQHPRLKPILYRRNKLEDVEKKAKSLAEGLKLVKEGLKLMESVKSQ